MNLYKLKNANYNYGIVGITESFNKYVSIDGIAGFYIKRLNEFGDCYLGKVLEDGSQICIASITLNTRKYFTISCNHYGLFFTKKVKYISVRYTTDIIFKD